MAPDSVDLLADSRRQGFVLLSVFNPATPRKVGCWKYAKWLLFHLHRVRSLLRRHALRKGDEHEKNNCHTQLLGDCAARIRAAQFDG
jgi:hypothetical protein